MTMALLLLLWGSLGSGQQLPYKVDGRAVWAIKPSGTTAVNTQVDTTALAISIHTWQTRPQTARQTGVDSYPECTGAPCGITDWIRVQLGGKPLWVGPYQIAGLGNVHYLSISGSPARLDLILIGGDAAESYEAHLIFNDQHVVERILYAAIDLSRPFEISHYFYGTIN